MKKMQWATTDPMPNQIYGVTWPQWVKLQSPFSRGVDEFDGPNDLIVERIANDDLSNIILSSDYFRTSWRHRTLFRGASDFELRDDYMFAVTKNVSSKLDFEVDPCVTSMWSNMKRYFQFLSYLSNRMA